MSIRVRVATEAVPATWVVLGFSLLPRGGCTYWNARLVHEVTCGGATPPSGQRLATVIFGVVIYLALALPAVALARSPREDLHPFALVLAILALCTPVLDGGFMAFTIAMC